VQFEAEIEDKSIGSVAECVGRNALSLLLEQDGDGVLKRVMSDSMPKKLA